MCNSGKEIFTSSLVANITVDFKKLHVPTVV